MLKYYSWAAAEKTLSFVPFGAHIYNGLGYLANRTSRRRLSGCPSSYRLARKAKELFPTGGTILDLGTGWHHHDALLLYLIGDYKVFLFDVQDKARLMYIRTYIQYLLDNLESVSSELSIDPESARPKLEHLLTLSSREEIYKACNFELCITDKTDSPFFPEDTFDFMVSCCVLTHIPPAILEPELISLRKMLKNDGFMYMLIGHDDHWSFHDPSANQFNYYRYSDKFYKALFETNFEYQNRFVKQEWVSIFDRAGLDVVDYYPHKTEQSRNDIAALPHIDERFAKYPVEELATIHSYFLLRRSAGEPQSRVGST